MTIAAREDKMARGEFKSFRNTFRDKPRKAIMSGSLSRHVLAVAKDHGKIAVNVCERGRSL